MLTKWKRPRVEGALAYSCELNDFEGIAQRRSPAMTAGVERDFWSVGDLLEGTA
jgi:hypothetical protein